MHEAVAYQNIGVVISKISSGGFFKLQEETIKN